jgi:hypothetical protein
MCPFEKNESAFLFSTLAHLKLMPHTGTRYAYLFIVKNSHSVKNPTGLPRILMRQDKLFEDRNREFGDAVAQLGQILSNKSKSDRVFCFKRLSHLETGETRPGQADVAKAVYLNSNFAKAKLLLANLYFRERDLVQARKESEDVLSLQPTNIPGRVIKKI